MMFNRMPLKYHTIRRKSKNTTTNSRPHFRVYGD